MKIATAEDELSFKKQAEIKVNIFMKALKKELKAGLKKGLVNGVEHCNVNVSKISTMTKDDKWKIGRTSHKLRNQKNSPEKWMLSYLDDYKKNKKKDSSVVKLGKNHFFYLKPLYVGGVCLGCHGKKIAPKVSKKIKDLYPEDQAEGFGLGDFRGFVWAEYKE